jgi:hypothetical protein
MHTALASSFKELGLHKFLCHLDLYTAAHTAHAASTRSCPQLAARSSLLAPLHAC